MAFDQQIQTLRRFIEYAQRIVVFTGAGISTDSGIPDYRSQGGIWKQFKPVYFQEFLEKESKRILYWQRKQAMWEPLQQAQPTAMHQWIVQLEKKEKLWGLITQNIDGLHEKSGVSKDKIVNLHGNTLETICLKCSRIVPTASIMDQLSLQKQTPRCAHCGGLLKPNTISFGQSLHEEDLSRAKTLCRECDLLIAIGSSLVVYPAAAFPQMAQEHGAKLVILNAEPTPLDRLADLAIHTQFREIVQALQA